MAKVSAMEQGRILVVDDQEQSRELLVEFLKKKGYVVQSAADGDEAWNLLNREPHYELVITDLNMPVMDGLTLLQKIRERTFPMEVILQTGFAGYGVSTKARELGAFAVLTKPLDLAALVQIVDLALTSPAAA